MEYILFHFRFRFKFKFGYVNDRFDIVFIDGYGVVMMYLGDKVKVKEEYRKKVMCAGKVIPRKVGQISKDYIFTIGPVSYSKEELPLTRNNLGKNRIGKLIDVFNKKGYPSGLDESSTDITQKQKYDKEEWLVDGGDIKFVLEYDKIERDKFDDVMKAIHVSTIEWKNEYVVSYSSNKGVERRIYVYKNGLKQIAD